ncbi:biopolymer transporter ExbD [Planctomycetota bacterium]|nr:biopolymer transporter ExbD [Planctomycetota bacterium]
MRTRRIRRSDFSTRIEMTPMIDVIFLLLTFFIYTLVVRVDFLPVKLAGVNTGQQLTETTVVAITISKAGQYFVNQKELKEEAFVDKLNTIGSQEEQPLVVVAMEVEDEGEQIDTTIKLVDRGPLILNLVQKLQNAGIKDFRFAGPPNP